MPDLLIYFCQFGLLYCQFLGDTTLVGIQAIVSFEIIDYVDFEDGGIWSAIIEQLLLNKLLDFRYSDVLRESFQQYAVVRGLRKNPLLFLQLLVDLIHLDIQQPDQEGRDQNGKYVERCLHFQETDLLNIHDVND